MMGRIIKGVMRVIRTEIDWYKTRRFLRSRQLTLVRR